MKDKKSPMAGRRNFLQSGIFGAAGVGLAVSSSSSVVMAETDKTSIQPEVTNEVDVLVVGGGTAGTIAAIQAGRAGAKIFWSRETSSWAGRLQLVGLPFLAYLMPGVSR